jgi:hypothetical protein
MPAKFYASPPWGPSDRRLSKNALVLQDYVGRRPSGTNEGLSDLPLGHVTVDTPLTKDEALAAFKELSSASLIDYDATNEVVLDRRKLRTNPLRHPRDKEGERKVNEKTGELLIDKRIPHAVRLFGAVPDSPLKVTFVALADSYSPDLADAIREDSTYAYPRTSEGPSKDHRSPTEGPSRDELSREEKRREEASSQTDHSRNGSLPDGWLFGLDPRPCISCSKKCHTRDPEGHSRHTSCALSPEMADVSEDGGF